MLNYKYTVNLDTPRSNCTIDNVQEVKIQRLPDTDKYDALCANGAMASFDICRFLKEYGRAFFFQAADILDGLKKGHEHFLKNDLRNGMKRIFHCFRLPVCHTSMRSVLAQKRLHMSLHVSIM